MILFDRSGCDHPQPTTDMQLLVHTTISVTFMLDKDNDLTDKKRLNKRMENIWLSFFFAVS